MNVASILAHQDDEMFCLGTMLKCRARGDRLFFITLTDGSKGFVQRPDIPRAEAAATRRAEIGALAKAAGGEHVDLGEPDEFLYDTAEVRMRLIEAIRAVKADLVFTHFHEDYNLDHVTTNALVRQCAMQACLPVLPTGSPPLREHPAVFLNEPIGPVGFVPTHYVDISAFEKEKSDLLRHHRSQEEAFTKMGQSLGGMIAKVSAFRGLQVGCAHAEGFVAMSARGANKPFPVLP